MGNIGCCQRRREYGAEPDTEEWEDIDERILVNKPVLFALGNPGRKYFYTKHNVGKLFLDYLAATQELTWTQHSWGEIIDTPQYIMFKSGTYMNIAANALKKFFKKYKLEEESNLVVVCDYLESKLGRVLLRTGGSHKGHNGLKSVYGLVSAVGKDVEKIPKILIGISRPESREPSVVGDYVLNDFSEGEQVRLVEEVFPLAENVLLREVLGQDVPEIKPKNAPKPQVQKKVPTAEEIEKVQERVNEKAEQKRIRREAY
jgi:PTH1 family peptidyl-tRNA hydrolase